MAASGITLSEVFLPLPRRAMRARLVQLFIGLILFGFGTALMVRAELGLSPWEVLHQGISFRTGVLLGTVGIIVGLFVLMAWIPLRERLGVGTVANVIVIGVVIDLSLWRLPAEIGSTPLRWGFLLAGVALVGTATGLYIGAGLGPGPRDGLMTGLARGGRPIGAVRTAIEVSVLVIGWLLGGTVGIGTVLFAFGVGPIVHVTLPWFSRDRSVTQQVG